MNKLKPKPHKTMEFKMNKPTESFTFDAPINLEDEWILGLAC